ncbi:MAG TPA: hypothetical protein PLD86_05675, partial [Vicinamibacteria bacterium]|nr:hypothetical protein [Vicinamibacteria bacterium]
MTHATPTKAVRGVLLGVALCLLAAAPALSQPYAISWYTVDGGGVSGATGGAFTLSGTIGQPDAGALSGGTYALTGGFWAHPAAVAPTVGSPTSASITSTTATLGGDVTLDGGSPVTGRGIVYSVTATNADPLIGGASVTQLTTTGTTGVFTVAASGLSASTGYSFKAYATNSVGTSYTSVATFTTGTPVSMSIADASGPEGYLSGSTM